MLPTDIDTSDVAHGREVCYAEGKLKPITRAIAKLCGIVGLPTITKHNYRECCARVYMAQQIAGPVTIDDSQRGYVVTDQQIIDHIGVKLAGKQHTKTVFAASMRRLSDDRHAAIVKQRKKEETDNKHKNARKLYEN